MEKRRRIENNKIQNEINQQNTYNRTDDATIKRFKKSNTNIEYNTIQISNLRSKIETRTKKLEKLHNRLISLEIGLLDEELKEKSLKTQLEIKSKDDEARRRKKNAKKEKETRFEMSQAYYNAGRQADRQFRWNKKGADKSYQHFMRACDSIPDYMRKRLKNMSNNTGYIWKSVHCYGERQIEKGKPNIMFERRKGGILEIHETTVTEHKIWHKEGKNRKTLHEVHRRKIEK